MVYVSNPTRTKSPDGTTNFLTNYIVATTNSSTSPANGVALDNQTGDISGVAGVLLVTKGGGTSPTASLSLQGSMDNVTWVTVKGGAGTNMSITAANIATASANNVIQSIDSRAYGRRTLPFKFLRYINTLGGTSPTWQGKLHVTIYRNPVQVL